MYIKYYVKGSDDIYRLGMVEHISLGTNMCGKKFGKYRPTEIEIDLEEIEDFLQVDINNRFDILIEYIYTHLYPSIKSIGNKKASSVKLVIK